MFLKITTRLWNKIKVLITGRDKQIIKNVFWELAFSIITYYW